MEIRGLLINSNFIFSLIFDWSWIGLSHDITVYSGGLYNWLGPGPGVIKLSLFIYGLQI